MLPRRSEAECAAFHGGTPIAGCLIRENPIDKWMIWGYPHFRKPSCGLPGSSPGLVSQVEPIEVAAIYSRRSSLWLAATLALVRQGVPFVWMGCELSKGREKDGEFLQLQRTWVCPKTGCTSEWPGD